MLLYVTTSADNATDDRVTLEEEKEDAKELDHHRFWIWSIQTSKPMSHLSKVGTLGWPHGSSTHAKDEGSGKQGVELRVELGGNVGGVAEDADHQGPLHLQPLDQDAWHEHAGEDQAGINSCIGPGTPVVHL